ncbi:MAG: mechanosensitive ion channel [SAR202 cluster bacterium]|nr:mechanosensitive ion channel [SAR202 cluster bacterium]
MSLNYLPVIGIILASTGIGLVFRDYLASILGGIIVKANRRLVRGVRVKILAQPNMVLKGDIISVGLVRTSLHEVGDGEHLPSMRTGRTIKVPNSTLVNSPIVIYDGQITDEVVAFEPLPSRRIATVEDDMREAIMDTGHEVVAIGLYQRESNLIVHGIYREQTKSLGDSRSRIIKAYLLKRSSYTDDDTGTRKGETA